MGDKNSFIIPASILGLCFVLGAIILALTWKSNSNANQMITVTGSAKQDIVSDLAILKGTLSIQQTTAEAAYKELQKEKPVLISYLHRSIEFLSAGCKHILLYSLFDNRSVPFRKQGNLL